VSLIRLALLLLWREWRAGEFRALAAALAIAVAGVTTVGFFSDRVARTLDREANQLLGGDLVITADHRIPAQFATGAAAQRLQSTTATSFPSMVVRGEATQLVNVKAISKGYPLRGKLRIIPANATTEQETSAIPAPGTLWVAPRLLDILGIHPGDKVSLGASEFVVAATIVQESDNALDFMNVAPRALINQIDLAATGLLGVGSRVSYRLFLSGAIDNVAGFRKWAEPKLVAGERIEGVRDARPEVRTMLERAGRFLGLCSLMATILAAVAAALAARRFAVRQLDQAAIMRCLGATQAGLLGIYTVQLLLLGCAASVVGIMFGWGAQFGLAHLLGSFATVNLDLPGPTPALQGLLIGLIVVFGFTFPMILRLRGVPTLRVIRREYGAIEPVSASAYMAGLVALAVILFWRAGDVKLASYVFFGFLGGIAVCAGVAFGLVGLVARLRHSAHGAWRYGLANLKRRAVNSVVQIIALGLGIMALLLLTLVQGDLLDGWRQKLPADAPNRFVVGIQSNQVADIKRFTASHGLDDFVLYPMVRGRLIAINDRRIASRDFSEERTKRLVDREFNLSYGKTVRADNIIVAGQWWREAKPADAEFSMEEWIAQELGIKVNDRLTFNVAGTQVSARVSNLRKVDWDSFKVNFYVIASPGSLEAMPTSFVTSFYLNTRQEKILNDLVRAFPNVSVIDVAAIMTRFRAMTEQVAKAIQFVFLFTVLAGLVVLYAAIGTTLDERIYESAIMRTVGARRRQLQISQLAEFSALGLASGLLGGVGASALAYTLSEKVLNLPFTFNPWIVLLGVVAGTIGVSFAGMLGMRGTLDRPPLEVIRSLS
jgi:putative ABC transport system permease protein